MVEPLVYGSAIAALAIAAWGARDRGGRGRFAREALVVFTACFATEAIALVLEAPLEHTSAWHARIGVVARWAVPLASPLWTTASIVTARTLRDAAFPALRGPRRTLVVGALVALDAALGAAVFAHAGLDALGIGAGPTIADVPWMWALGAGALGAACDAQLTLRRSKQEPLAIASIAPSAVLLTHAVVCASWWLALRWMAPVAAPAGVLALVALPWWGLLVGRRASRSIGRAVFAPRAALGLGLVAMAIAGGSVSLLVAIALAWAPWLALTVRGARNLRTASSAGDSTKAARS